MAASNVHFANFCCPTPQIAAAQLSYRSSVNDETVYLHAVYLHAAEDVCSEEILRRTSFEGSLFVNNITEAFLHNYLVYKPRVDSLVITANIHAVVALLYEAFRRMFRGEWRRFTGI